MNACSVECFDQLLGVFQGPEASSHAHEAGYDAYMTGAAFACLMRLHEAARSKPEQTVPSAEQQPSLESVQNLLGRINIGRCVHSMWFPHTSSADTAISFIDSSAILRNAGCITPVIQQPY